MSKNSDYFFLTLKEIYPTISKPSVIDEEIWEDMLEPFEQAQIRAAIKSYRSTSKGAFPPLPAQFKEFLYPYTKRKVYDELPLSPATHIMEQDIKAGRCKHLFPTYEAAVNYLFDVRLKEVLGKEEFAKYPTRGSRYYKAVDLGLFADFDDILEIVYRERRGYGKK